MKRKITKIEQCLINDGWYLELKRYAGNHSEKSLCYEYHKKIDGFDHVIMLSKKRDEITKYGIDNVKVDFLDKETLYQVHHLFLDLKDYVESIKLGEPYPIPNELLESVE